MVKNPKEMTNEELIEIYPKLVQSSKLSPDCFSTTMYTQDIKEEILRRLNFKND